MSQITVSDHAAVLVRAADAEQIGFPPQMIRLLADSSSTGGTLSAQRVTLQRGADGANPHHHASSAELFYVLSGTAQLLASDRLLLAAEGDLAIVPPGLPHAFAAAGASDTDLLIVITPGIERFEYFRHLARIATGQQPPREPARGPGALRHLLRRQPGLAASARQHVARFLTVRRSRTSPSAAID